MQTILRGRVVARTGVIEDGLVVVDGARIAWVGPTAEVPDGVVPGRAVRVSSREAPDGVVPRRSPDGVVPPAPLATTLPPSPSATTLLPAPSATTLLPGLVDLHCHGGGGVSFPDAPDEASARVAVAEHLRHGTTTLVASLVTADTATLLERSALLAGLADTGDLAGIHLEGPYLSPARCGAQDPTLMTEGDADVVQEVARVARGHLVTMTVAPEVPGVLGPDGVVTALARVGALPSFGHTDAGADLLADAIAEAGVALAGGAVAGPGGRSPRPTITHLFNGMRPLHHRDPGPVAASLSAAARGEAVVELVADGVHLAPATIRMVFDLLDAGSIALVTDAMAAAGMPDGFYTLGSVAVHVNDGVARLKAGGALAGGTAHMLDLVRTTVAAGVDLADAVTAASATPAAVLGRTDIGALEGGRRADVVEVDENLRPLRVMRVGSWVAEAVR